MIEANLKLYIALFIVLIIGLILSNVSNPITRSRFIYGNYLYLVLALLIISLIGEYNKNTNIEDTFFNKSGLLVLSIIMSFVLLFSIFIIKNPLLNHAVWLAFVILMGFFFFPIYQLNNDMRKILFTLICMIVAMSVIGAMASKYNVNKLYPFLFIGLLGLIMVQLLDFGSSRTKYYTMFGIGLFNVFLIYDVAKLYKQNIDCPDLSHLECAQYPKSSLGIILDVINLYSYLSNNY